MKEIFIGDTLRRERHKADKTQEDVCEGLCELCTISRIENGWQTPTRSIASALLQRLGLPRDRYYAPLTPDEEEVEALQEKIEDCTARFRQSLGEEKRQARLEALGVLDQLEAVTDREDNIGRQYILAARAALGGEDGPYSFEVRLDMLREAIRLTAPRLTIEALDGRLYSFDEAGIIGQIAEAYSDAGQHEKAAGIFYQLLTYAREHDKDVTQPSRYLPPATLNYARELCLMGRYAEALETAELGQKICLNYGYCQALPGLLAVMAESRYAMGDAEQSRALFRQAYYLFRETGHACGAAAVEASAREKLGDDFLPQEVIA